MSEEHELIHTKEITLSQLARTNKRSDDSLSFTTGGLLDPEKIETNNLEAKIFATNDGKVWLKPTGAAEALDLSNPTTKIELLSEPLELSPYGMVELEIDEFDIKKDLLQISVSNYSDFRGTDTQRPNWEEFYDLLIDIEMGLPTVMLAMDSQTMITTQANFSFDCGRDTIQYCGNFPYYLSGLFSEESHEEKEGNLADFIGAKEGGIPFQPNAFSVFVFPKSNRTTGIFILAPFSNASQKEGKAVDEGQDIRFRKQVTSLKILKGG
ncbi:MAG: hypothetical protein FWE31_04805 [Firmicutes bacterium]|nr:hypothetical protein [Bacillota bacterium]